jgi:16S rRNA (cytidine1402-2'-O)-methyltransferase
MRLILLPNLLDEKTSFEEFLPLKVKREIERIDGLIAESEKNARFYLRQFLRKEKANNLPLEILNEHTKDEDIKDLIKPLLKGETWGLISDSGLPCIADPGSLLVAACKRKNILVDAILGPSSIILALMLSGLISQKFCFNGYLPIQKNDFLKELKRLERISYKNDVIQIFIETPYRFKRVLEGVFCVLRESTFFCVAENLMMKGQKVISKPVSLWKKTKMDFSKKKAVFLIYARQKVLKNL